MTKMFKNAAVALATGSLIFGTFVPASLGQLNLEISGNGTGSTSSVNVSSSNTTVVDQSNTSNVTNNVSVSANSGDNQANDNTGGDVGITTGDSDVAVGVTTNANSNTAAVNNCGNCLGGLTATVSGNGSNSENTVSLDSATSNFVTQNNIANVTNIVDVTSNTGGNRANRNTGGDVVVTTGDIAVRDVSISTNVNANQASIGGSDSTGSGLSLWITGNGTGSDNSIDLAFANTNVVDQSNESNVRNDISVTANSGDNRSNDNTGGDVMIETGDADMDVTVDTAANFNLASILDCCLMSGTGKISGNGSNSDNVIGLDLETVAYGLQSNLDNTTNIVDVESESGNNQANANTSQPNGEPSITTGNSGASIAVDSSGNSNGLSIGEGMLDEIDAGLPMGFPFGSMSNVLGFWAMFFGTV